MGSFHFKKRTAPVNDTTIPIIFVPKMVRNSYIGIHMALYGTFTAKLVRDFYMEIYVRLYRLYVWLGIAAVAIWRKRPSMASVKTTLEACRALVSVINGMYSMSATHTA